MRIASRVLLSIVLLLTLLVALLQVAGRVATHYVDDAAAAQLLERYAPDLPVSARGVRLRWHRFNPILEVEALQLGDSRIDGLLAKFDALESLLRWGLVLRDLRNDQAQLQFVQAANGAWGLAGMPAGQHPFNWRATVEHSDQLQVAAQLKFAEDSITVALQASNKSARRRWSLQLMEPDCGAHCLLAIELEEALRIPLLQPASLAIAASVIGEGVRLPAALLGGASLRVSQADVRWDASRRDWRRYRSEDAGTEAPTEQAGRLEVALQLTDVRLPGGLPFDLAVSARGSSHPGYALARSFAGSVTQGETVVSLPEFWLRWVPDRVQLFAPRLDLTTALAQVARSRADDDALGRWLRALKIQGELSQLQAQRRLDVGGWAWRAQLVDGATTGYQGAPTADALFGTVVGYERGLRADIAADRSTIGFPGVFSDLWVVRDFSAQLDLHWHRDYLALLGHRVNAHLVQGDASAPPVAGSFRLAVPADRLEQTLALALQMPSLSFATAKRFLPSKLNADLRRWLLTALEGGALGDVEYAYLGHVRGQQGPMARRSALRAQLANATVQFDSRWPEVTGLEGTLGLSGQEARAAITAGVSAGLQLAGSSLLAPPGGRELQLTLRAELDGAAGLAYIRQSPLAATLPFVTPDWQAAGPLQLAGSVRIPLGKRGAGQALAPDADVAIQLINTDLELPGYRLAFAGLNGALQFRTPNQLTGTDLAGALLGKSLGFDVRSDSDGLHFDVRGQTTPEQVYALLGVKDPGFAAGAANYRGSLSFPPAGGVPALIVETDLVGIELDLPAELGKPMALAQPTGIQASFGADEQQIVVSQMPLAAALTVVEGAIVGGTVQLRGSAPELAPEHLRAARQAGAQLITPGVVVSGALASLPLGLGGEGGLFGPVPIRFEGLQINRLMVDDETSLGAVAIAGTMQGEAFDLQLFGADLGGQVTAAAAAPLAVDLTHLHLPGTEAVAGIDELEVQLVPDPEYQRERVQVNTVIDADSDPLPVTLIAQLPGATVSVEKVLLGDEDFGSWQFAMQPQGEKQGEEQTEKRTLEITDLAADVRGLRIEDGALTWHAQPNETHFSGTLRATDLAEVLPLWGYAPSIASSSAVVEATVRWPGSPVNINLLTMNGDADFTASDGRFAEVEAGNNALRIFSLLNFNAFAKRMNFDFSDVVGRGVSFEEIAAPVTLSSGDLRFRSPMSVEGTGSSFKLGGTVDLDTGALANDMVVTLPLTKGLPWYAAYVALANPLAGVGVLVGERLLRKPLEQFSSARYRITGTLDAPKAKLVSIFDNDMETAVPDDVGLPLDNTTEAAPEE